MSDALLNATMDKLFDEKAGTQATPAPEVVVSPEGKEGATEVVAVVEGTESAQEEDIEIEVGERKLKKSELEQILRDNANDNNWKQSNARKSQEIAEEKRQWEAKRTAELAEIEANKQAKIELDRIKATEEYQFIQERLKENPQNTEVDVAQMVERLIAERESKKENDQKAQETARTQEQFWKGVDEKGDAFFTSKLEEIRVLDPTFDVERARLDGTYYTENPILKAMSENMGYALQKGITDPDKALQFAFNSAVAAQDGGIDKIAEFHASKKVAGMVKNIAGASTKTTAMSSRAAVPNPEPYNKKDFDSTYDAMFDKIKK